MNQIFSCIFHISFFGLLLSVLFLFIPTPVIGYDNFGVDGLITMFLSPLKQFETGISPENILCKESFQLLVKNDGTPACVKSQSSKKLVERGWGTIVTQIVDKANTSKSMKLTNSDFVIYYNITGGDIVEVKNNMLERSIQIFLENTDQGMITIILQKSLIDSTFGQDFNSEFFVMVDKKEVEYEEIRTPTNSTLTINLQTGAKEIQIIGSGEM